MNSRQFQSTIERGIMNKPGLRCAAPGAALLVAGGLAHAQPAGKLTGTLIESANIKTE
jgi:hypothetical protein